LELHTPKDTPRDTPGQPPDEAERVRDARSFLIQLLCATFGIFLVMGLSFWRGLALANEVRAGHQIGYLTFLDIHADPVCILWPSSSGVPRGLENRSHALLARRSDSFLLFDYPSRHLLEAPIANATVVHVDGRTDCSPTRAKTPAGKKSKTTTTTAADKSG